jgi:3'-5' exoribonuclease
MGEYTTMKIKDLNVGSICDITLVVKSAVARETKAKKPYLQLEFYDGTDTISGNYWDWTSGKMPEPNAILDIGAQVTEWMGKKQLNVKTMVTNTTRTLNEFAPESGHDMSAVYKEAYALLSAVRDDFLRDLSMGILDSLRQAWLQVPGAKSVHHAYIGGTLVHSLSVAKIARAIAKEIPEANIDLCVVGGLLHDLGKLYTYKLNGVSIEMTDEGLLYEHTFMGAEFVGNFAENNCDISEDNERKLRLLRHIILSHHGSLDYGAAITPKCIEAFIVSAADGIDASVEQVRAAASKAPDNTKWTERIYTLSNSPQLKPEYVQGVMGVVVLD